MDAADLEVHDGEGSDHESSKPEECQGEGSDHESSKSEEGQGEGSDHESSKSEKGHWVSFIKENLKDFSCSKKWEQEFSPSIYRVGARQKKVKPEHFNHEVISLGLYDRSNEELNCAMTEGNKFRLTVVSAFLHDAGKTEDWDTICGQVVEDPEDMQQQYDGLRDELDADTVKSILTLDALFLACWLAYYYSPDDKFSSRFPSVETTFGLPGQTFYALLGEDIIKLENQISLVLIENAFTFINEMLQVEPGVEAVQIETLELETLCAGLVEDYLQYLPGFLASGDSIDVKYSDFCSPEEDCQHFLDCLYKGATRCGSTQNAPEENETLLDRIWLLLSRQKKSKSVAAAHQSENLQHKGVESPVPSETQQLVDVGVGRSVPVGNKIKTVLDRVWHLLSRQKSRGLVTHQPANFQHHAIEIPVPSATQLVDVGVEFRGRTGGLSVVEFKVHRWRDKATLFLPKLDYLGDNCEMFWRNLVAYENEEGGDQELMAYFDLMDDLIDTERDVAILKTGKHRVIGTSGLGSDDVVAKLFNTIGNDYEVERPPKWSDLRMEIHKFNNDQRRNRVEFMKTYFGKWWLTASLFAAAVLLVMTLLQTILSFLSYINA